ncbi:ceramidase domain-containing protein [Pseudoruegeria sp. HB172150]|uniref:ceramidase domain-containing protein n=1 Tax=Pseudoruegeria sp. HB172150 TaxID=2721164 RepID=UPI001551C094|nr:ceramidase domain-containing protein [Pseudoruegeria sp. HB172150]
MNWTAQIDAYCERLGPGLLAEPLNAMSNAAFLIAAFIMWRRLRGRQLPYVRAMILLLALVGLASLSWHVFAIAWTGAADSLSILLFVLLYLYAATRTYLLQPMNVSLFATFAFLPVAGLAAFLLSRLPFFRVSAEYWPVVLLIAGYALVLSRRYPETARNLAMGAALLTISISVRSLDSALCARLPIGTHFLWHILNATMLAWMIETYARHVTSTE